MGRVGSMQDASDNSTVASASYDNGTGLLNSLSYFGFSETRQFNNLLQMTRQTVSNGSSNVMDQQYLFPAAANNGRITSSVDNVLGETVNYTYDSLNRLASAYTPAATNLAQGKTARQSSTYGAADASRAVDGNTNGNW